MLLFYKGGFMKKQTKKKKTSKKPKITVGFINNKIRAIFSENTKHERKMTVSWIDYSQHDFSDSQSTFNE
jgi:hypothetical protein